MVFVRCVDRSAVVTFCPTAPYYLAGSAASAIDLNFSTASVLEVFKVDFSTPPPELPLAGVPITVGERFHSVAWGKTGIDNKLHPLGLVAGGLEDGSVNLWDPNRIVQGSDATRCTVAKLKKHASAVRALDFNPNLPQFLATGSTEPELLIWDLTKPSIPVGMTTAKLPPPASGMESDFTCTKWNEKVHQILASCTTAGKTIVQDMRRMKPVATLHDLSSSRRCSVLEWSPERPTQVLVASDDDRTPTIHVWDLRNSGSPLSELAGHSKGILSMSWSPHDPRLLLTCAKDSKTYCWDVMTSQIVAELPPLGAWHLHVQWSPITPGLFSVSSFDGKIGICSFNSMTGPPADACSASGPVTVVPNWMQRPGGLSFGFGGKLVSVTHAEKLAQDPATGGSVKVKESKISIQQIAMEAESVPQSETFDAAIRSGDRDQLSEYCTTKKRLSAGEDSETWELLGLMFSVDAKRQLLLHLGFDDVELPQPDLAVENGGESGQPKLSGAHQDSGVNAALDFFENLPEEGSSPKASAKPPENKATKREATAGINEEEIQKALLVRNYEAAVEECLKGNRAADALIIAHVAGHALFDRVMNRYMEENPKPFMSLISSIAMNDFQRLIQTRPASQWRETLAMLVAYIDDGEQWASLCDALGLRLYQSGDIHGASLCFICSGNVEKAVGVWSSQGAGTLAKMQEIIEKAFILGCAVPQQSSSQSLCTIVHNYAQILASQGSVQTALEYLDLVPGEPSESIQILKDRIYGSGMVTQPEETWSQDAGYAAQSAPAAAPDYGAHAEYQPYQQTPQLYQQTQPYQQSPSLYQEGYSEGYMPSGGYDPGYQAQHQPSPQPFQPSQPTYTPSQQPFQPSQPAFTPSQQPFQPSMPSQVPTPTLFTPQPSAAGLQTGAVMTPPPVQPPPSFQPSSTPTQTQPRQSVPAVSPQQQPFVPPVATPQMFNPAPPATGAPTPASPVRQETAPLEPMPPPDMTALSADTSNVPGQFKPIVTSLKGLFTRFESANVAPSQKRIVADASKRIGVLFWDLNRGKINSAVAEKVMQYAQALSSGDTATATKILAELTDTAWNEATSHWLSAFKRLIRLAQTIK